MASAGPRQLLKKVKMRVPAGNATAAPPVGPTLGQAGVNLMDFCKLFNARTAKYKENIQLPVKLFTYSDRSFEFQVSTPISYGKAFIGQDRLRTSVLLQQESWQRAGISS